MDGPSPVIHNLLFEEATPQREAQISFSYDDGGTSHELTLTATMVRTHQVQVQGLIDDVPTFFVTCKDTTLFLDDENIRLFRDWCRNQRINPADVILNGNVSQPS